MLYPTFLCPLCSQKASKPCQTCFEIHYCSSTCRDLDKPLHHHLCPPPPPPPTPYVRIIYLPSNSSPQFIYFPPDPPSQLAMQTHLLSTSDIAYTMISSNSLRHLQPNKLLCLYFRRTALRDGSPPNFAVKTLLNGDPAAASRWRGPILVMATEDICSDAQCDLEMVDLRHVADFFKYKLLAPVLCKVPPVNNVVAVRINSDTEMEIRGRPKYEAVHVLRMHRLKWESNVLPLSLAVGMPLVMCGLGEVEDEGAIGGENNEAQILQMGVEGEVGGSVLVVGRDMRPVLPAHVAAMIELTSGWRGDIREIEEGAWREELATFWMTWLGEKDWKDEVRTLIPKPYFGERLGVEEVERRVNWFVKSFRDYVNC